MSVNSIKNVNPSEKKETIPVVDSGDSFFSSFHRDFLSKVKEDDYGKLHDKLEKDQFKIGGKLIPFFISPFVLDREKIENMRHMAEVIGRIMEKTLDLYFSDSPVRSYVQLKNIPEIQAWIDHAPTMKPVCDEMRVDVFPEGNHFKIVEINAGGPIGAKDFIQTLNDGMSSLEMFRKISSVYRLTNINPLEIMADYYSRIAREKFSDPMTIAMIWDESEEPYYARFLYIQDYLRQRGFNTELVHLKDLEKKNGRLTYQGRTIDLAHLNIELDAITAVPEIQQKLIDVYREGTTVFSYCPRSRLGGSKEFLAVLSDPQFHHYFTEEEKAVILESIPWTRIITPGLKPMIQKEKDRLVIKPCDGYCGKDVQIGKNMSRLEWGQAIETCLKDSERNWITQEVVNIPEIEVPTFSQGKMEKKKLYLNLGPFVLGGRFAGVLGRVSESEVINVLKGGGVVPVYYQQ